MHGELLMLWRFIWRRSLRWLFHSLLLASWWAHCINRRPMWKNYSNCSRNRCRCHWLDINDVMALGSFLAPLFSKMPHVFLFQWKSDINFNLAYAAVQVCFQTSQYSPEKMNKCGFVWLASRQSFHPFFGVIQVALCHFFRFLSSLSAVIVFLLQCKTEPLISHRRAINRGTYSGRNH